MYFMNCYQNALSFPTIFDLVLITSDPGEEWTLAGKHFVTRMLYKTAY